MNAPVAAASALVVRNERLLLVRRGPTGRYAGLWSLPGGRIEHGEKAAEAIRREVREETGLEVRVGPPAGVRDVLPDADGDAHYVIVVFRAEVVGGALVAGDDAAEVSWVPLDDVDGMATTPGLHEVLRGAGIR